MKAGNKLIQILSDTSLAILLLLPVITVYFLIKDMKKFSDQNGLLKLCSVIMLFNFMLIKISIDFGIFYITLFWQFFIMYPISIGFISYILKSNNNEVGTMIFLTTFFRKQKYVFVSLIAACFIILAIGINDSNQKVLDAHNQLMEDLVESENQMETLIFRVKDPGTMLDALPFLQEIKDGEVQVLSLPWKSTVKVTINRDDNYYTTREFTYVRFYREWQLDGEYKSSGDYPSDY